MNHLLVVSRPDRLTMLPLGEDKGANTSRALTHALHVDPIAILSIEIDDIAFPDATG
jgi:hypothetical protein